MAKLRANPKFSLFTPNGNPAAGWKIYTYEPGTSSPKATYTDYTAGTANTNPVILDGNGNADIWWNGSYKVVVYDENDVLQYTVDNYGEGEGVSVQNPDNLLSNPSFENGDTTPDNWAITLYTDGTQSLDSSDQHHALKSLKFVSIGTGGGYAESDLFEVTNGRRYFFQWAIKSSIATVRNVVEVVWYDKDQVALSTTTLYDESTSNPTSWTEYARPADSPASARYARLRLTGCHSSDNTPGSTWFDDAQVKTTSSYQPFAAVSAGGTANALTATLSPAITAILDGLVVLLRPLSANTSISVTLNLNGLGAKSITKHGNQPLYVGDIAGADHEIILRYNLSNDVFELLNPAKPLPLIKLIEGLALSNNSTDANNDIDIAAGKAVDSTGAYFLELTSGITKQLDAAWAAGTDAGGLFSGTKASDTWYHAFLIRKDSDGSIDAGFDTSIAAANIPSGYTAYRMIGSILTDSSGNILGFTQKEDEFYWDTVIMDVKSINAGTSAVTRTLSTPLGIQTRPIAQIGYYDASVGQLVETMVTNPDETDTAPAADLWTNMLGGTAGVASSSQINVLTNTSSQIRTRQRTTSSTGTLWIMTKGFVHPRGAS